VVALSGVTLTQLEAFVLVARLGSVTAAARTLGVSEPAISGALAALRRQFGDNLVERTPNGMTLTPGGRRLVGIASQMVALGAEAEEEIRRANGAPERLRVTATNAIAESVAPALLAAFQTRAGPTEVSLGLAGSEEMAAVLQERLADVALGPRISGPQASGLECLPLFRYHLVFVVSPEHRLAVAARRLAASERPPAGQPPIRLPLLVDETWLVDPDATDPASPVNQILTRLRVPERNIRVFPSQAAAWAAAQNTEGIAPAINHLVAAEVARGSLVTLPVEGMPLELMWYSTTLVTDRRSPSAAAFQRFVATPDATHAMHTPSSGVPPSRFRPPVYVTIWS
jgi:LysR family transcriptional regulator, low CO2-responsive transcriptional regulator